ncbi:MULTISPECIES: hypothetical protein [Roseobacteraceae]|uniref:COG4315 family predicted lipoprotein n=1 Tax=Roseobacteraceae TaxID=2854170 RepID=UPI0012600A45|nr:MULTISPECIES: hypothetical protein [Roseobacteraceae]KAB6715583.1 hypothetical protein C8029_14180 [Roseobacter sp. TSBP12]|tara:strand:+ start:2590 stop:2967 length:378 start_codon:yes stop_codon:yes gene_type:complete
MMKILTATALSLFALTAPAFAENPVLVGELNGERLLMDAQKMTLYTFDKDEKGVSNCYEGCIENWPALTAESESDLPKGYSLITRKDGVKQVAYKDQPLYLWVKDMKPGDMTGDGVKGVWHTARP